LWSELDFETRASIFLKAAELLSGPWRWTLLAATILGQSKNFFQAEIDASVELIDFLRFNAYFAQEIYNEQLLSSKGVWNRMVYRPLEGFIYAITPVRCFRFPFQNYSLRESLIHTLLFFALCHFFSSISQQSVVI
jgi:1-pyrroline-5-carboxylate dehydrogenase